ncbi:hypothetical protein JB92DRAFT_3147043 [Gautieria morchelliformis]|nr:hypothetical protein JB92DRAFT_3147043 [Gautieria morchelliformis]
MASSPLAHLSSKNPSRQYQLYQPGQSSPLLASSSPTYNVQARRKRQYKSQSSSRPSLPTPNLISTFEDTPQKQFLRERFKAHCLERARKGRGRTVQTAREASFAAGTSSDGFDMDDDVMDEGDENILNDEIYRRVMLNEAHRSHYAQRVSFEAEFGSSIDPNMYEDMNTLEWEFTGKAPKFRNPSPTPDELEDALIQEYLSELDEMEQWEARQSSMVVPPGVIGIDTDDPGDLERAFTATSTFTNELQPPSPSQSTFSDFTLSSPQCSPSRSGPGFGALISSPTYGATWSCPFCSTLTSRSHVACTTCATQYSLDHARSVWFDADSHPGVQGRDHVPLATKTPNESGIGVVMLCGAPECDWCFAF